MPEQKSLFYEEKHLLKMLPYWTIIYVIIVLRILSFLPGKIVDFIAIFFDKALVFLPREEFA